MERQQAFTILASAGASAAVTAALLFLWLPAAAPPGQSDDARELAALRREIELLKDELVTRSNALPAPMVAERVVEIEGGRARDELARRCDELLARCNELEETVTNLSQRLEEDSIPSARALTLLYADGTRRRGGATPIFGTITNGVFMAGDTQALWATQSAHLQVDPSARPINTPAGQ